MFNFLSLSDNILVMDTVTVTTEKTVFGGLSIAKIDSKTVFIPYSMPGETLSVKIVQHKNDYDNAEIVKIIKASPNRVQAPCKYYGQCGGCNMMHIAPEYQRELRKQMLADIFADNKIKLEVPIQTIYGPDTNYRARFQFTDGGLSKKSDNTIINIDECLCAEKVINDYLANTPSEQRPQGRIHVFGSDKMQSLNKVTDSKSNSQSDGKIKIAIPQTKQTTQSTQNKFIQNHSDKALSKGGKKLKVKENHYFKGTIINDETVAAVKILDKTLHFDVRGFFQSNLFVFEQVIQKIMELLPGGQNIIDIYAGCGSISTFLTDKYENVTLVEHNRDALVFAEQNLAGKKHVSYGLSGENWVKTCSSYCPSFDACVIDPPRSGMEKAVCDYLCKSKIPVILSMSCDPATHARDAARLIQAGYTLEKLYLLDFYPNTSHIESLALFIL